MQSLIKEISKRKIEFFKFLLRFLISLVFGIIVVFLIKFYLFSHNLISSEDINKYLPIIKKFIETYLPFFEKSKINQILFIFFNNLRVVIFAGILSFITFGIFAEIVVYINGFIIGALISSLSIIIPEISGIKIFIFGILPHGVFEIFAFLISLTFAHSLSFTKQGIREINIYLRSYIIVIPTLFLASIIEVLITPLLLGLNLTI